MSSDLGTSTDDPIVSALVPVVMETRKNGNLMWADPDLFVGPIGGRFVTEMEACIACERIGSPFSFKTHHPILAFEHDGLLYVAGGSQTVQAVSGVIPIRLLSYKVISLKNLSVFTERSFNVHRDGGLLAAAVDATESRAVRYSPLQDTLLLGDLFEMFKVQSIFGKNAVRLNMRRKLGSLLLDFYNRKDLGSIRSVENQRNREEKVTTILALLKLNNLPTENMRSLLFLEENGKVQVNDIQLKSISRWSCENIIICVKEATKRYRNTVFGHRDEDIPVPVPLFPENGPFVSNSSALHTSEQMSSVVIDRQLKRDEIQISRKTKSSGLGVSLPPKKCFQSFERLPKSPPGNELKQPLPSVKKRKSNLHALPDSLGSRKKRKRTMEELNDKNVQSSLVTGNIERGGGKTNLKMNVQNTSDGSFRSGIAFEGDGDVSQLIDGRNIREEKGTSEKEECSNYVHDPSNVNPGSDFEMLKGECSSIRKPKPVFTENETGVTSSKKFFSLSNEAWKIEDNRLPKPFHKIFKADNMDKMLETTSVLDGLDRDLCKLEKEAESLESSFWFKKQSKREDEIETDTLQDIIEKYIYKASIMNILHIVKKKEPLWRSIPLPRRRALFRQKLFSTYREHESGNSRSGSAICFELQPRQTITESILHDKGFVVEVSILDFINFVRHPKNCTSDLMFNTIMATSIPELRMLPLGSVFMPSHVIGSNVWVPNQRVTLQDARDVIRRSSFRVAEIWMTAPVIICAPLVNSNWTMCIVVREKPDGEGGIGKLQAKYTSIYTFCGHHGNVRNQVKSLWTLLKNIEAVLRREVFVGSREKPRHYEIDVPEQIGMECGPMAMWHASTACISKIWEKGNISMKRKNMEEARKIYPYSMFVSNLTDRLKELRRICSLGVRRFSPILLYKFPSGWKKIQVMENDYRNNLNNECGTGDVEKANVVKKTDHEGSLDKKKGNDTERDCEDVIYPLVQVKESEKDGGFLLQQSSEDDRKKFSKDFPVRPKSVEDNRRKEILFDAEPVFPAVSSHKKVSQVLRMSFDWPLSKKTLEKKKIDSIHVIDSQDAETDCRGTEKISLDQIVLEENVHTTKRTGHGTNWKMDLGESSAFSCQIVENRNKMERIEFPENNASSEKEEVFSFCYDYCNHLYKGDLKENEIRFILKKELLIRFKSERMMNELSDPTSSIAMLRLAQDLYENIFQQKLLGSNHGKM